MNGTQNFSRYEILALIQHEISYALAKAIHSLDLHAANTPDLDKSEMLQIVAGALRDSLYAIAINQLPKEKE